MSGSLTLAEPQVNLYSESGHTDALSPPPNTVKNNFTNNVVFRSGSVRTILGSDRVGTTMLYLEDKSASPFGQIIDISYLQK